MQFCFLILFRTWLRVVSMFWGDWVQVKYQVLMVTRIFCAWFLTYLHLKKCYQNFVEQRNPLYLIVWPKLVLNKNSFSFASNSKSNLLTSPALSGNKMKPSQVCVDCVLHVIQVLWLSRLRTKFQRTPKLFDLERKLPFIKAKTSHSL